MTHRDTRATLSAAAPIRRGQHLRRVGADQVEAVGELEPCDGFAMDDAGKGERVEVYLATRDELERLAAPPR